MRFTSDRFTVVSLLVVFMLPAAGGEGRAQSVLSSRRPLASNVVVPQSRAFSMNRVKAVEVVGVDVRAKILGQAATTTMEISLRNPTRGRQEAELIVPVPDGAVVKSFTFQGAGSEPSAVVLPREEARETYNAIVARVRDPALLEFVGYNLIRSSVFPVEPGGKQKLQLTYEHLLPADGGRIDYVLPRSESILYNIPWKISLQIKSKTPITTVYSPSHTLLTDRQGPGDLSVRIADSAALEPGAFRLSWLLEKSNAVTASLFAYPDPKIGGGYFLLLAGLPTPSNQGDSPAIRREITLVLDRSGSMNGEKIEQVREAAKQVLAGLMEGESFNIIAYNEQIDLFSETPVPKTAQSMKSARAYLDGLLPRGGTNIHDALLEAMRSRPADGALPIVLFLTDGLPTIGQTSEKAIRNVAMAANPYNRRIFTFGVGMDVNTPLLDKIARETRATATFVLPEEDIEVKVARVFNKLAGPVLAGPRLNVLGPEGKPAPGRVRDVLPGTLPDLFDGDQLVVLGTYVGTEPLLFSLRGDYLGADRAFRFSLPLDRATTRNGFVPRLWASRKIAVLVDAIRESGADVTATSAASPGMTDPRMKELVDEVVRLSMEFGILTEYTAFLAREGSDLAQRDRMVAEAAHNFTSRALYSRSGKGSVNQELNIGSQRGQSKLNFNNYFLDRNMNRVAVTTVQQLNDRAFYRRGNRWVDSRIFNRTSEAEAERVIEFGTQAFDELLRELSAEGRQGIVSLKGEILVLIDGEAVIIRSAAAQKSETADNNG